MGIDNEDNYVKKTEEEDTTDFDKKIDKLRSLNTEDSKSFADRARLLFSDEYGIKHQRIIEALLIFVGVILFTSSSFLSYSLYTSYQSLDTIKEKTIDEDRDKLKRFVESIKSMFSSMETILITVKNNHTALDILTNINRSLIDDYNNHGTTNQLHGVALDKEIEKRTVIKELYEKFHEKHPMSNEFLRYTILLTPYPNCEVYVMHPLEAQMRLNRSSFKDHPWCTDFYADSSRNVATAPYWSSSQHNKVSGIVIPIRNYSNVDNLTSSYLGGMLSLSDIVNKAFYDQFNLDPKNSKLFFLLDFPSGKYKTSEALYEPLYRNAANNSLTKEEEKNLLEMVRSNNLHNGVGSEVRLNDKTYTITYVEALPPLLNHNEERGYKWTLLFMRDDITMKGPPLLVNNYYPYLFIIFGYIGVALLPIIYWLYKKDKIQAVDREFKDMRRSLFKD